MILSAGCAFVGLPLIGPIYKANFRIASSVLQTAGAKALPCVGASAQSLMHSARVAEFVCVADDGPQGQ